MDVHLIAVIVILRGTMRGRMKPQYVRTELVLQALDEAFAKIKTPAIFNSGELSDSLMNPPLMKPIVNKFEEQKIAQNLPLVKMWKSKYRFSHRRITQTSDLRLEYQCT